MTTLRPTAFSGGLHGVGVSVTNALSTRLEVEVVRDGARHQMAFAGGEVVEPLRRVGDAPKKATGTRLRAWPDPAFFDSPNDSAAAARTSVAQQGAAAARVCRSR
jgi:DNA gyrase/topoisomerase IV subunit B